jgi:hypothetical protein
MGIKIEELYGQFVEKGIKFYQFVSPKNMLLL